MTDGDNKSEATSNYERRREAMISALEEGDAAFHQRSEKYLGANVFRQTLKGLAEADPNDVQKIAASQLELMLNYHNVVLDQARRSFWWAITAGAIGFGFFVAAVTFALLNQPQDAAVISAIGGTIAELLAATFLFLYGKTTAQLGDFHKRLDTTQRHLLANSIAASMDSESQQEARLELVRTIAQIQVLDKEDA